MRSSGHPSRPRAITCCFFASFKTLLISTKATCLTPKSTSRASFSLAGFQVTLIGRFWVTPEVLVPPVLFRMSGHETAKYVFLAGLLPPAIHVCFSFFVGWHDYMPLFYVRSVWDLLR